MARLRDTTSTAHDVKLGLPRLEMLGLFACAALMTFGLIFSISAAVMSAPRDVRLADDTHRVLPRTAKAKSNIENAALKSSSSLR